MVKRKEGTMISPTLWEQPGLNVLRSAFFPFEPAAALRSTQTQSWLAKIKPEEAKALDDSYEMAYDKKGMPYWWKATRSGKVKRLRSQPAYARTKTYLDKYFKYKDDLKVHGEKIGFIMPQDAFFMWFFMPMPKTWTKKKKAAMAFKMHKNHKDTDNLSKAIKDALAPRKSNFVAGPKRPMDDRVISSYANAKIYLPDEHKDKVGTLIIEYDLNQFLRGYFQDAMQLIKIQAPGQVAFL
jgi:hypothetical protein